MGDRDEARSATLHTRVVERIEKEGKFWFSTTVMKGQSWFRVNVVNFRTRLEHMDALFAALRRECESVVGEKDSSRGARR